MVNDPIADLIIRIKNAGVAGRESIEVPYSKLKHAVADAILRAGFIDGVEKRGKSIKKNLEIKIAYTNNGTPKVTGVQRISKPGRRLYKGVKHIFPVKYGKGAEIFSTPEGVLTDAEARKKNVGGEELFKIW